MEENFSIIVMLVVYYGLVYFGDGLGLGCVYYMVFIDGDELREYV